MKKLLLLVLSIVISCSALVSCEREIGADLDEYINKGFGDQKVREEVELDLYIITEDTTDQVATKTVNQAIDKYTTDKYKVRLDIHYFTESEYRDKVTEGVETLNPSERADIVLINDKSLFSEFMNGGYLAPLDSYLDSTTIGNHDFISKDIPKLKKDIPACLWDAVASAADADGNTCFAVPNNRCIGSYDFLVIDRQQFFAASYSENLFKDPTFDADAFVLEAQDKGIECSLEKGQPWYMKAEYEAAGNICVTIRTPVVRAKDAFSSAFAVVKGTKNEDRAMEIIYALNTDSQFRNLLQYGDNLIHHTIVDGNVVYKTGADAEIYRMNILYTGNIFTANYCSELGWTPDARANAEIHNKDAKLSTK